MPLFELLEKDKYVSPIFEYIIELFLDIFLSIIMYFVEARAIILLSIKSVVRDKPDDPPATYLIFKQSAKACMMGMILVYEPINRWAFIFLFMDSKEK